MDPILTNKDLLPTTKEQRTWSKWHIAALWVGMSVCIPTYTLASGMIEEGWSWKASVGAVALGNLIVLFPMILNAHAGTRYGIPFPVLLRSSFGVFGANIPALMRAFVACGWFGIQTWIGGSAIFHIFSALAPQFSLPFELPSFIGISVGELLCFLLFWAIQVAIILKGIDSIRILESWAAPFLLSVGVILFLWAWVSVGDLSRILAENAEITRSTSSALLGAGITGGVAFWGTLALNIPDFARFAKTQKDQVVGQTIGLVPTMTAFAFIGAIVTNATIIIFGTRVSDPVALLSKATSPLITMLAMVGIVIATLTTNLAANIVSPANDFSNLSPQKISFKKGALIASIIGILIMPWKLYNDAANYLFTWLIGYGAMLGSVAGIMIADYYFLRRCRLNIDDLYRTEGQYTFKRGFNLRAIFALLLGILPSIPGFLGALGLAQTNDFWTAIYDRAWFVGLLVSALTYLIASKVFVSSYQPIEKCILNTSANPE